MARHYKTSFQLETERYGTLPVLQLIVIDTSMSDDNPRKVFRKMVGLPRKLTKHRIKHGKKMLREWLKEWIFSRSFDLETL